MQEGIYQIGKAVYSEDDVVDSLVLKLSTIKNKKQQHVLRLDFDTKENHLKIHGKEEVMEDTSYKYLYVDKIGGPTAPQYLVTRNSIIYHLTETIPFLIEKIENEVLKDKLHYILENFYIDRGEEIPTKYRYTLDIEKLGMTNENIRETFDKIANEEKKVNKAGKNIGEYIKKLFDSYVKEELSLTSKDIGIYTIYIDGEALGSNQAYRKLVIDKKLGLDNKEEIKDKEEKLCMLCNKKSSNIGDLTKLKLKFFTTNQVGFANNLNKNNYYKNMNICNDCMNNIQAGETYIMNRLATRLFGFSIYLIPHFIVGEPLYKEELDAVSENIIKSFNSIKSYRGIETMGNNIEAFSEYKGNKSYYHLNLLFFKKVNQGTKVKRLIKDVNPSIFTIIQENSNKTYFTFKKLLGEKYKHEVSLESIYYLTPIRLDNKKEPQQYNELLNIYDCIFTRRSIKKSAIIDNILKSIRIIAFNKASYNIDPEKNLINNKILEGNALIKFLELMGCIKEEEKVSQLNLNLSEEITDYINGMNFNEEQTGLFLLGTLVGHIGNSQYKRTKNKPILNKLNYSGIDKIKLVRLINEVHNKLIQEKILKYNELTFHNCKMLIDKNINNWNTSKSENLYYILSGYGYATTRAMLMEKKGDNNDEK